MSLPHAPILWFCHLSFVALLTGVSEVRFKALLALQNRLRANYSGTFITLLPLVSQLGLSSRTDKSIKDKICNLYTNEQGILLLLSALKTERRKVRLQICDLVNTIVEDIPDAILDTVVRDSDLSVRFWLTRWEERLRYINVDKAQRLRKLLMNDSSAKIRSIMIQACVAAEQENIESLLAQSVFDSSVGVRDAARYYLSKKNPINFASWYQNKLTEKGERLRVAIAGLGETGSVLDYDLILPFLSKPASLKLKFETLKSLVKLDSSRSQLDLLRALGDHHPKVNRYALTLLPKRLNSENADVILEIWQHQLSEENRTFIVKGMLRLPSWIAGITLLKAMLITPSQAAVQALESWSPGHRKNYDPVPPNELEKRALKNALEPAAPYLNSKVLEKIRRYL